MKNKVKADILELIDIPEDLLDLILSNKPISSFRVGTDGYSRRVGNLLREITLNLKPSCYTWKNYLESLTRYKECSKCNTYFVTIEKFNKNKTTVDGYSRECKTCDNKRFTDHRNANTDVHRLRNREYYINNKDKYKEAQIRYLYGRKQATPPWANLDKIKEIYDNCPEGYHVDHIIPLKGKNISGLHVETNLQYLTAYENRSKGNRFNGE